MTGTMTGFQSIGLLGFGEVGRILGTDLAAADVSVTAWDVAFEDPGSAPLLALEENGWVAAAESANDLARQSDLVISAVTAAQDLPAAESVAGGLAPETWFLDLNSVSPDSRRAVAKVIDHAGGRYVEAAVMAPFGPKRLGSPILLGGSHAEAFLALGRSLGFTALRVCDREVGRAAAVKMCRSVIVKGLEALVSESLLAARRYGIEDEVLATLNDLFPRDDWPAHARYLISRTLEHGARRSEEMVQAAETVRQAGVTPWMSEASVERQAWAPDHAAALEHEALGPLLDAMLAEAARPEGRS